MSNEVLTALISAITTLFVSIGTWHVTLRQYRQKNEDLVKNAIADVKDTVTANISDIQSHLAIIDLEIKTLSDRTDKHNQVIERTFKLEQDTAVLTEQIKVANHRIEDLEKKA